MIRALYHAFKLYIKIHGETFCCLTFLILQGRKISTNIFQTWGDEKPPYKDTILASLSKTYKSDIAVSL